MTNPQSKPANAIFSSNATKMASALALLMFATVSPARAEEDNRAPDVPAALQVPAGNKVHFHAYAVGVQIYTWNGSTWGASVPEAVLFDSDGDMVGIHYAGPTWETESGSKVLGTRLAAATVDPTAIPWLLLKAVSTEGPGVLADTTYIQRVNTAGGKAPAAPGTFVGEVARVPYTAEYFFYRAK